MDAPVSDSPQRRAAAGLKAFMLKSGPRSSTNLYEHLARLLVRVMDERPEDCVEALEQLSLQLKRERFLGEQRNHGNLREPPHPSPAELLAKEQRLLFTPPEPGQEEEVEAALPNVGELAFFLEQAGGGLGPGEMQRLLLALRALLESQALPGCRLWGKVLGTGGSYMVAEAPYREGDEDLEEEPSPQEEQEEEQAQEENKEMDSLPQSSYRPPPPVPMEALGTGANRFVYYVCSAPGLPWIRLPAVSPAHIAAARASRRLLTGRLDAAVPGFPPFPGREAHYLRAQIARISAGTQVSPQGFYQAGGGEAEEEEEEEAPRGSCEPNPDFEGLPAAEMAASLSAWVHHAQHILQQGRCSWVNLAVKPGEDSNEEAEEEKEEESEEPEPEVGPPLLTPLSQDAEVLQSPPWSSRLSSLLTPQHAAAVLRSNLWPGASAYACGRKFDNFYVGWGLKYAGEGYSPPLPPPPQAEYPRGPEVTEALDPSLEEEQAVKEALEEQQAAQEEMEEEEEEEEDD